MKVLPDDNGLGNLKLSAESKKYSMKSSRPKFINCFSSDLVPSAGGRARRSSRL